MAKPDTWVSVSALCLEIVHNHVTGSVRTILSIPGREGTFTRTWTALSDRRLTESQLRDFLLYVHLALEEWLLTSGAQLELWQEPYGQS